MGMKFLITELLTEGATMKAIRSYSFAYYIKYGTSNRIPMPAEQADGIRFYGVSMRMVQLASSLDEWKPPKHLRLELSPVENRVMTHLCR